MRALIVDDEEVQLETLLRGLKMLGHEALAAANVEEAKAAYEAAQGRPVELVITDLTMPGGSGTELVAWLREREPELPVIVITGLRSSGDEVTIRELGIPILRKPFSPHELDAVIQQVVASS